MFYVNGNIFNSHFQIALVSPSEVDYEESICTLRYASRVKYIKNQVRINVETKKGLIECFEQEIAKLQERISVITMYEEKAAVKMVVMLRTKFFKLHLKF